jgi:DNA-binding FadR family transcriptional regulator
MAIYLHAVVCTAEQVARAGEELETHGGAESRVLLILCEQVRTRLCEIGGTATEAGRFPAFSPLNRFEPRALVIAGQLLRQIQAAPADRIGTETALSERFMTSPETLRQALRILSDLDLLVTRKGRSGGAFPKQPQPIGVVRQFFAFLAGQQAGQANLGAMLSALNLCHLHLAHARLQALPQIERRALRREGETLLDGSEEPMRFVLLQEFIGRIARNPMIDTLLRCLVAYQMRVSLPEPMVGPMSCALHTLESGILAALCDLRIEEADHLQRAGHRLLGINVKAKDIAAATP